MKSVHRQKLTFKVIVDNCSVEINTLHNGVDQLCRATLIARRLSQKGLAIFVVAAVVLYCEHKTRTSYVKVNFITLLCHFDNVFMITSVMYVLG